MTRRSDSDQFSCSRLVGSTNVMAAERTQEQRHLLRSSGVNSVGGGSSSNIPLRGTSMGLHVVVDDNFKRRYLKKFGRLGNSIKRLLRRHPSQSVSEALDEFMMTEETEREEFYQEDLPLEGFPVMDQIRSDGRLCDIMLKVEESSIQAHRIVLAATIPYFHAMFTTDMLESKQREVTMQGMDFEALEALINFAYTGRIMININNVQSIMMCASFLHLNKVKDACAKFLTRRLTSENVLGIRAFADTLHCEVVVKEADKFIQKHFLTVSRSEEFLQLNVADVQNILACDDLNVESEEQVYTVLMNWVHKDSEMRGIHLHSLLKFIRMPLLSPEFITDHVATEPLIRNSHQCRDLLDEARDYYLLPDRRSTMQTFRTRPRCCDDVVGLVYVVGGLTKSGTWPQNQNLLNFSGDSISTVEVYDPLTDRWKVAEAMKMLRSRVGVAVMKNRLYAIGGFNGQERLATVEVYDPITKAWSKVASMNFRRSAVGAASLNDRLYVCGGYDGTSSLNTVECYYPEKNDWMMTTPMMKHRSAAGVVAFQGYIYALGGHDGLSIFDSVERYDPQTGQWTVVAPMLTKRCRLGASSLNNKLYVCGGYDGSTFLRSVEVYDPIADEWSEVAPMSLMRSRVALVANLGKLWAIGGYDGASNLSTVEVYDPVKNTWKNAPPMCAHEGGVGVGVIPIDSS